MTRDHVLLAAVSVVVGLSCSQASRNFPDEHGGSDSTNTTSGSDSDSTSSSMDTSGSGGSSSSGDGPAEKTNNLCSDGLDNDHDGLTDCFDPHCKTPNISVCAEDCGNGI